MRLADVSAVTRATFCNYIIIKNFFPDIFPEYIAETAADESSSASNKKGTYHDTLEQAMILRVYIGQACVPWLIWFNWYLLRNRRSKTRSRVIKRGPVLCPDLDRALRNRYQLNQISHGTCA